MTDPEREFAALLAPHLRTPRSVKKYTNLYRLVRAHLDEEALDAFLLEQPGQASEYQAVLTLLAVVVELPEAASDLVQRVADAAEGAPWLAPWTGPGAPELSEEDAERLDRLRDAVAGAVPRTATNKPFRTHAREAARYSFSPERVPTT